MLILRRPRAHFLTAYNADSLSLDFRRGSIRIARIHVSGSATVSDEVANAGDEGPESEVNIADDVERETVPANYNPKETKICQ